MKSTFARRISILLVLAMVLAMLPLSVMAATPDTLYLKPGPWSTANAWFSAYFFVGETANAHAAAVDSDGDGVYEIAVPEGDWTNVIFLRNNPADQVADWNGVWNQTADLALPTDGSNMYTVTGWGGNDGSWGTYVYVEPAFYVCGTMNGWTLSYADHKMVKGADGVYSLTLALEAGSYQFKVNDGTWNASWGKDGGSTNIEFVLTEASNVVISMGADKKPTVTSSAMGEVETFDYYLVGSMNEWSVSSETGMAKNEDGTYSITVDLAAGSYEYKANNGTWDVCFPAVGEPNATLTVDTACAVTFTLDVAAGTIVATGDGVAQAPVEPPVSETVYYVAGSINEWNAAAEGYAMTANGDGTYSLVLTLTAGNYELKVTDGTWDNSWTAPEGEYQIAGGNLGFYVSAESEVTVTFDGSNVYVSGANVSAKAPEALVVDKVVIAGGAAEGSTLGNFLYGQLWTADSTVNVMYAEEGTAIYTATYYNVEAGTYEFKFVLNDGWDINFASGVEIVSGETTDAWFQAKGNSTFTVAEDGSTVTFVLDLTNVAYVGDNAKMSVTIEAPVVDDNPTGSAPDELVIGTNDFVIESGNRNPVVSTYTATYSGILAIVPTAMATENWMTGMMEEVPAEYIKNQFGWQYGIVVNGETLYSDTIEVVEGETYEIGVVSNMGNPANITLTLCDNHVCVVDQVITPACGETGYTVYHCTNCNYSYNDDYYYADHNYTYAFVNKQHTLTCSICGDVISAAGTNELKFRNATLSLASDISVIFKLDIDDVFEVGYMVFEVNGEETYVYDYTIDESNGRKVFAYQGINPQMMGDSINCTIHAYLNGTEVTVSYNGYSVVKYCNSQFGKTDATVKQVCANLLEYGAAVQLKKGYKTDALVNANLPVAPETFPGVDAITNQQAMSGTANNVSDIKSVALQLSNKVEIKVGMVLDNPADYEIKVTIKGNEFTYGEYDLEFDEASGRYYLYFSNLNARDFDETITFVILKDGVEVSRTLTYSVNSYIAKNGAANTADGNTLRALYCYGKSTESL